MSEKDVCSGGTYRCENCGDTVRVPGASGEWDCVICGGRMVHTDNED